MEWLLHGIGEPPPLANTAYAIKPVESAKINDISAESRVYQEKVFIEEELNLFRRHYYPQVLELWIADDSMLPHYQPGDLVAGHKCYGQAILKLVGQICLVQLTDGSILLRELQLSQLTNHYQLRARNATKYVVQEVELIAAAAVSWWRRKDPLLTDL